MHVEFFGVGEMRRQGETDMQTPLSALALASILAATVSGAAGAHNARSSEWFRYSMTEAVVTLDPANGPVARGVYFSDFRSDLEYGDGRREQVTGRCSFMFTNESAFSRVGVCVAPGAYTLAFRCQATPEAGSSICRGELTGALDGQHNGLAGEVTYEVAADGIAGVGAWNY
jgi:hypothetical protein